jgi:hypothetical protein
VTTNCHAAALIHAINATSAVSALPITGKRIRYQAAFSAKRLKRLMIEASMRS